MDKIDLNKLIISVKACAHHPDHDCDSCEYCSENFWCYNDQLIEDFEKVIQEMRTVILCKDCRYFREETHMVSFVEDKTDYYCEHKNDEWNEMGRTRGPEWYCADAERKE